MKTRFSLCLALASAALLGLVAVPLSSNGQAGAAAGGDPATAAMVVELSAQQAQIETNQAKIDEKLALIAEDVRQARLFVARGGGSPKAK
jgi:hypothetical protein